MSIRDALRSLVSLRTLRPPHAFVLTRNRLVYVGRRDGRGAPASGAETPVAILSRPLPEGALRPGPAGIPVAGASLAPAVSALVVDQGAKLGAASLAIPDDFVRVLAVDVDDAEKGTEVDEVLRWKFGKLFGEPSLALRIAWQAAGPGTDGVRVLAVATPEECASSYEDAFLKAGVRIGALESAALAVATLARRALAGDGFVVWADGDAATTVFFEKGALRFVRTKATSDPDEALQEIRLAASFVAPAGGGDGTALDVAGACAAGPVGSPIVARFRAFRAEEGGKDPAPISRAALAPSILLMPVAAAGAAPTLAGVEDPALLVGLGAMAAEG